MKKQLLTLVLALASTLWSVESVAQCTVQTGPLTESFDSQSGGSYNTPDLPSCWNYYSTATYPYAYVRNYSYYANSGTNAIYWYRSSSSSYNGDSAVVMSPKFDLSAGNYEVKFSTRSTSTSSFYNNVYYVGVADSAGTPSSITVVDTFTISSTTYSEYTVDLNAASGVGTGDSRVVFMMTGDGSTYGYALIDDIKIRVKKSCNDISNLSAVTSANGVSLSWDGDASHISYTIEYDTAGFTPGNGTTVTITSDSTEITGLTPVQNYDFYVTGNCSATSSGYAVMASAYSPCAAIATPWTENFDNTPSGTTSSPSLPQCWDFYANASLTYWYPYIYNRNYSFGSYSGNNFLYVYRSSSTSTSSAYIDTVMAIMPEIIGLDSANKQLKFYARNGSTGQPGEIIIGFTDAAGTPSSLRIIDTINASTSTYQEYTVYLDDAQSGDARVAFYFKHNSTFDYAYIDDVSITDIPPCPEPISLSLTSATKTDATIAWSSSSAAFDIEVGPMGFAQGTGTSFTSTTNSVTVTGLTQNTYYDAYLRSNCSSSGDGYSAWVGPFTFKTECGWFVQPYSQDFGYSDGTGSSTNPDLPDCWNYYETGGNSSGYAYVDKYYYWGNQATDSAYIFLASGYVSSFSGRLGDTIAAILPLLEDLDMNDKQLLFNARGYSGAGVGGQLDAVIVGTTDSTGDMSTFHIVDTILMAGSTYQDYTVDLTGLPSGAARVVMAVWTGINSGYSYGYNEVYVDHVELRQAPQCPEPFGFTTTVSTDTSATIDWSDSSVVSNYFIEWGQSGFTQGTGATIDTVSTSEWSSSSLTSNTTYDFYVQSECSALGINSPWFGPITITTPCSPTAAPWADGFETSPAYSGNSSNPNLPSCWAYDGTYGTSYSMGYGYSYYAYSGSYSLYNYMYSGGGDTNVISAPMIQNIDQGGLMVKFWARTNSTSYPGGFDVVMTDAAGNYETARTVKNMSLNGNTSYQQYQVYLDSNAVQAGDKRVGFRMYSKAASYDYVYIDSVQIEAIPACINYNQMASNVTSTSADLTWDYTGTNCFNVEYGPAGFIQGTGVGALSGTLDTNVTAPYSLTGLNPNTSYEFYVQNCCNNTWEGPFMFQTECTGPLAAGTYSVGPTGDFATLDSVTSTLNVCGIAGAVTFEFQSGSFSTSTYMGEINGSSSTNTITFKGSTSANDTIIAGTDAAFVLEGAKYMNFEDLFIYTPNNSGFRLNGASDITISGNTIMSTTTSTSSAINGILASASATSAFSTTSGEHDITIENNEIIGGYYGVRFYGSFAARNGDIVISGNTMTDQYYYGIYVYYGDNIEISDNELSDFRSNFAYGIYPYQVNGCQITGNHISDLYYGIYGYYMSSSSTATAPSEITNNMINAGYYGLNVLYSDSVGVYHNTAVGGYAGVRDYYNAANVNFRNNIFTGGTYALYNYNTNAFGDYNLYYSTGTYLGYHYVSSPYAFNYIDSIGELQSMDSTMHMNSVEGDPIFATATDLHVYGPLANDAGDNTVGVTVDIDGDSRPMSGSTTVDIGADEYDVIGDDAALTALLNPANGICGDDSLMVSVQIANNGQNTLTSLTVSVDIFGTTMTATPTGLSILFGEKDTVELGYISNFVGGTYSVVAYTQLTGDGRPGNDTLSLNVDITDAQQVTPVYPEFICAGDDVNLSVTNPTQGKVMWASGGDTIAVVDADSTIMLSSVMMDTTITVSSINYTESVGQLSPGSGYNYTGAYGLSFTAYSGMSLDSVTLFPSGAGTSTIVIEDASGTQLYSIPVTTSATGWNPEQVYLGASLPSGSYKIWLNGTTTGGLYDNLNSSYPYWSGDSSVVITGDRNGGTSWYEYFYDWKVTVGGCAREDSTFTVSIHPDAVAAISVDTANATISATDWMANWSTSGTTGADSIYVEFSNGTSSNDTSGTVTFNANNAGETVTVIAFGPCSSDTATFTFDVNQISVDEDFLNGTLSIYPNPTRGLFNVEFATASATDVEISIVNMVGQVISTEVVTVNGLYNNQFDLSNESAGVYFIKFTTEEGVLTERITVE
jgi:parallel beta-helix repeat protein